MNLRHWSPPEIASLLEWWHQGATPATISREVKRSQTATEARIKRMGLVRGNAPPDPARISADRQRSNAIHYARGHTLPPLPSEQSS